MPSIGEYFPGIKEGLVTFDGIDIADLGDILDENDNEILEFDTVASSVNHIRLANAATSGSPEISAQGDDTNVSLTLSGKGTGGIIIDENSNAAALTIDTEATTANALDINGNTLTTGKAIDVSDLDAITTGKALHVDATGVTQTDGILVHIDSASTALTATGRLLLVDHTGNAGVSNVNSEFLSAATDETVILQAKASAALALGKVVNVSGAAVTTGTLVDISDNTAHTTGTALNVVTNSADTGTRSLVNIKQDHASASGATPLTIANDNATKPLIDGTATATSTNFFKIMTANGVTLWMGNGNTGNAALSGTAGDILFNGGSNKPEYCTGTTNWTALV